jgi:hypothetical protein
VYGRGVSHARAPADYDDVSEATVEKHCLERYLRLQYPSKEPAQREEKFKKMSDAHRRTICKMWQPVYRSARCSTASSMPCGMDSSTCRASRCCGDCGLSRVGYSHHACAGDERDDLMKCQRCEQIKQKGFEMDYDTTKKAYESLQSRRKDADGNALRTPRAAAVPTGYEQGAARGRAMVYGSGLARVRVRARVRARVRVYVTRPTHAAGEWKAAFQRLCTLERRVEVDELLHSFNLPLQARESDVESDEDRERRLARAMLSHLQIGVWADGSPICNRSFQAHTFSFMCASPPCHRATCLG